MGLSVQTPMRCWRRKSVAAFNPLNLYPKSNEETISANPQTEIPCTQMPNYYCLLPTSPLMPRSHQTFRLVLYVKLLGSMLRNRCWPNHFSHYYSRRCWRMVPDVAGVIDPSVIKLGQGIPSLQPPCKVTVKTIVATNKIDFKIQEAKKAYKGKNIVWGVKHVILKST